MTGKLNRRDFAKATGAAAAVAAAGLSIPSSQAQETKQPQEKETVGKQEFINDEVIPGMAKQGKGVEQ